MFTIFNINLKSLFFLDKRREAGLHGFGATPDDA